MFTEGEEGVEYDEDGNEIPSTTNKKNIDPLPVVYHSQIDYKPFKKNFYNEHEEINNMNLLQIIDLRHKLNIKVQGTKCPKPVSSFAHFGFPEKLISAIRLLVCFLLCYSNYIINNELHRTKVYISNSAVVKHRSVIKLI